MNDTFTVTTGTPAHAALERANSYFWQLSLRRTLTTAEVRAFGHIRAQLERMEQPKEKYDTR